MSVIIKGMKLPKHAAVDGEKDTVYRCAILAHPDNSVELVIDIKFASAYDNGHNIQRYPITEIPSPHGDLIDKEPIKKFILDGINKPAPESFGYDGIEILAEIEFAPAIIEAEHESEAQKWARVGRDISKGLQEGIVAINSEVPDEPV